MAPSAKFDVTVAGAGVAGLTAALSLAKAGAKVAVLAPAPVKGKADPRTTALLPAAVRSLDALGIWNDVSAQAQSFHTMRLIDDRASSRGQPSHTDFDVDGSEASPLAFNTPNGPLLASLRSNLEKSEFAHKVVFINAQLATAVFHHDCCIGETSTGQSIETRLLVGADGRNSSCRQSASIQIRSADSGQFALAFQIRHSKPHGGISTEIQRLGGPFTIVPMPGNQSSVVWIENVEEGQRLLKLGKHDFDQQVARRCRGLLGEISSVNTPQGFPVMPQLAQTFIGPRLALVAEAAHVLPPTGAQGLNLSLTDVAVLSELVAETITDKGDPGGRDLLELYEKRRLVHVMACFSFSNGLNWLTAAKTPFVQSLRRHSLSTIRDFPSIKKALVSAGLQPLGYVPEVMQSRASDSQSAHKI